MSKIYVFPIGNIDIELITKDEFDKAIKDGRVKGHTHVQIKCVGYSDRVEAFDSAAFKSIAANPEGYNVYAIRTGYPFYSNCNKFRYDPYISGVTEKPNNSFGVGLADFIMN